VSIFLISGSFTMKAFSAAVAAMMASSALAFVPFSTKQCPNTQLSAMPERMWDKMVDKTQRSKSVPFLPRAPALDGTAPGDYGFDPFFLSSIDKNFAGFIQPPSWEPTQGLPTIYWMREAEIKNGRVAMLAWFGWLATDGAFGITLRFPGDIYSVENIPTAYDAHNILVEQGSMTFMILVAGLIELTSSAALLQVSKGELTDREPGEYGLDPMGFLTGKSAEEIKRWNTREINNGRLAMLAFGGVATQTALEGGNHYFPYF
jgi:hypothetical protein